MSNAVGDLLEIVLKEAEQNPDRIALKWRLGPGDKQGLRPVSFSALKDESLRLMTLFAGLGHGPDQPLAICLPVIPAALSSFMAAHRLGPVIMVDPMAGPEKIAGLLRIHNCKNLITLGPYPDVEIWPRMERVRAEVPSLEHILQVDLTASLGRWQRLSARSSLRRYGKAEPIPGQQIGDALASAAKLNPMRSMPDVASYPVWGLNATTAAPEKWEAVDLNIATDRAQGAGISVWAQALRDAQTLAREIRSPWEMGYTLMALSPLGWQQQDFSEQVLAIRPDRVMVPLGEWDRLSGMAGAAPLGEIAYDLAHIRVGEMPVGIAEIEQVLRTHPLIHQAAVVAGPDPELGQIPVAYLQIVPNGKPDLQGIYSYCQEKLPAASVPRAFRIVDRLPRLLDGNIDRRPLAAGEQQV